MATPDLGALVFYLVHQPVQVIGGLAVDDNLVGTRLDEIGNELLRLLYLEMDVEGQMGGGSDALHDDRPHGNVGDEMAVHDINVDVVGAGCRHFGHLLPQAGEVGGKDGRGQLY